MMQNDRCGLLVSHGVPIVVCQALDDRRLAPASRLMMWALRTVLDFHEFRPMKVEAVAAMTGVQRSHAANALAELHDAGYLEREAGSSKPGRYRMPWSRRPVQPRLIKPDRRGRPFERRRAIVVVAVLPDPEIAPTAAPVV